MYLTHHLIRSLVLVLLAALLVRMRCGGGRRRGHRRRGRTRPSNDRFLHRRSEHPAARPSTIRSNDEELQQFANVNVSVYNMQVLLTGQAENAAMVERFRDRAVDYPEGARRVYNEVSVGAESTWSEATADAYLTSKVKVALFDIDIDGFDPTRVDVTSSLGSVYLMGLLTVQEADAVTEEVRFVSGVKARRQVVRIHRWLNPHRRHRCRRRWSRPCRRRWAISC
jgi:osmotically-inducible protein OsmY